jgi:hypothetical protein
MIASFFHESNQEGMTVSLNSLRGQKQNKSLVENLARQNGRQMQIVFTNGGHYVFATNCHKEPANRILIDDSLFAMRVDDWFEHQLAAVFRIGIEFDQLNVEGLVFVHSPALIAVFMQLQIWWLIVMISTPPPIIHLDVTMRISKVYCLIFN